MPRERILHVAQSLFHDHAPAKALGMTTVWIDRRQGRPGFGATPPAEAQPDLVCRTCGRSLNSPPEHADHWRAMTAPTQDAVTDVVLARQPIFDADLRMTPSSSSIAPSASRRLPRDPEPEATATVLVAALTDVGLERLVGDRRAFINVNREFLLSFRPLPLPADRVVLELVEDQIMDTDLMDVSASWYRRLHARARQLQLPPEYEPLLRLAKIGKLDVQALSPEELAQHVRRLRDWDLPDHRREGRDARAARLLPPARHRRVPGLLLRPPAVMAERSAPTFRLDALAKLIETGDEDFDGAREDDQPRRGALAQAPAAGQLRPRRSRAAASARSATRSRCSAGAPSAAGRCC